MNKKGEHYVIPVQARGRKDQIGIVQVEQDFAICQQKFPNVIPRPVSAQFLEENLIALFEFEYSEGQVTIKDEKHYRLVPNDKLTDEEILQYNRSS